MIQIQIKNTTMGFDYNSGGHAFDYSAVVCQRCGMTRKYYEDNGKPRCTGQKLEKLQRFQIPDD